VRALAQMSWPRWPREEEKWPMYTSAAETLVRLKRPHDAVTVARASHGASCGIGDRTVVMSVIVQGEECVPGQCA
jgi:hypothetical protein